MNHVRFHGAMRPMRTRVIKDRRVLVDWRNPIESSAVCCLVIGLAALAICALW